MAEYPFQRNVAEWHVRELAREYGLRITWAVKWWDATSLGETGVLIPRPWSARLYLVCLHEVGHHVDALAARHWETTRVRDYLVSEAAATGWAIEHILPTLAEGMSEDDFEYLGVGLVQHGADLLRRRREALLR